MFNALVDSTAANSTLTAADKILGGAGNDVLNVTLAGTATSVLNGADVQGVEKLYVRNTGTGAAAVDAQTAPGVTTVVSDRSTGTLAVTNLENNGVIAIKGNGSVQVGNVTAGYKATATNANIEADGGTATGSGSITINAGAALVSANITSTSAANVIGGVAFTAGAVKTVAVDAQSNVTTGNITGLTTASTINVKGAGTANIGTLQATNVTKLDASANTGGVTAVLNDVTTLSVTGGSGNDVFTTGAILAGAGLVDAGAGTGDRLVVSTTNHIDATSGKLYKGFEQVQVQDGQSVDVSLLATNNTIDTIRINNTSGTAGATNLTAAQAANVQVVNAATGVITLGVKDATNGGQIDTVKAALTTTTTTGVAQNVNLTGITLAGVEKLELTANATAAATAGAVQLTTTNATVLDSIKLASAGVNTITIAAGHLASNLNVDASASTGATAINASAYNTTTGATLTTGSGNDAIFGSAKSDTIVAGAGNDLIYGDGGTAEVQSVQVTGAVGAAGAGNLTVAGITVAVANSDAVTAVATKAVAAINAAVLAGTAGNIASAAVTGGGSDVITITYKATAGNVAAATVNAGATSATFGAVGTTTEGGVPSTNSASDTLTGGEGKDVFGLGVGAVADADWIKDLNLGTDVVGGQVDTLVFANAGATKTLVTLTSAQQTTVTATANIAAAAAAVLGVAAADGATAMFTYGSDTYIIHNGDGNNTYDAGADILVKVTGVTGTLDLSDFSVA